MTTFNYRTRHHAHWERALLHGIAALGLELAFGWTFVEMVLLAAAAAEVAIGWQVRERGMDEPVFEQLLKHVEDDITRHLAEEDQLRSELGLPPRWDDDR